MADLSLVPIEELVDAIAERYDAIILHGFKLKRQCGEDGAYSQTHIQTGAQALRLGLVEQARAVAAGMPDEDDDVYGTAEDDGA